MTGGRRAHQVVAELRERIALGDYGPEGALESEAELGTRYGVSRITVRTALETLRGEGLVASRKGAGWFVAQGSFGQRLALGSFQHAGSAIEAAGESVSRTIIDYTFEPCPASVHTVLGVRTGAQVMRVSSVRRTRPSSRDPVPLDTVTEWVPGTVAETISRRAAEDPGIWATIIAQGRRIDVVRQSIAAVEATSPAAEQLGVPLGAPLLHVRRVAVDHDGAVLALADHRYVGHRFRLDVEFRGWPATSGADPPGVTPVSRTPRRASRAG